MKLKFTKKTNPDFHYSFLKAFAIHKHPTTKNSIAGIRRRILFIVPKDHHANRIAAIILNAPLKIYIIFSSINSYFCLSLSPYNWPLVNCLLSFKRDRSIQIRKINYIMPKYENIENIVILILLKRIYIAIWNY